MTSKYKKIQLKTIKLIKLKKPSSFSSLNLDKKDKKKINLIKLSSLFNSKIHNDGNEEIIFNQNRNINFISSNINNDINTPLGFKSSSLIKYNSLSQKLFPLKHHNIKLPKIKIYESNKNNIRKSHIDSIISELDKCNNRFKNQSKSSLDFEKNFNNFSLNEDFLRKFKYNRNALNHNYKKIYPKLLKRIKEIKSL